ncbi:diacylglycerol/lipid kinase family protein [Sediminicola arcticus]|uniref:YegS/Rv2252/BmrU family lipid kinase n=1 Tax=Sediminicola arcticus TaxID=1574308 RepID=A0ABV2SX11_9FLAO
MEFIHFIVNPVAGYGKNPITEPFLKAYFEEENYTIQVKYSTFKKQAILLTKESILEGATIIVACGGDGTINEVASCLVRTPIILGIIPIGSGNGLASNLQIPSNVEKAIAIIKNKKNTQIDVGSINDRYFFSNTGIGFAASVIKNYEQKRTHTLWGYITATFKSFKEFGDAVDSEVSIDKSQIMDNPFMIFISNSNELGYKVSLTPKASLQDGYLDVVIVPKIGRLKIIFLILLMLFNKQHILKEVKTFQTKKIQLYKNKGVDFEPQIDGDVQLMGERTLNIALEEGALNVFVTQPFGIVMG